MVATGETVGLAEWIIDDTCLVPLYILSIRQIHNYVLRAKGRPTNEETIHLKAFKNIGNYYGFKFYANLRTTYQAHVLSVVWF